MNFNLNSDQDMIRKSVAEFLKKECPYETVKDIEDSESGYEKKIWKKMSKLELQGICFPEEFGGFEDDFLTLCLIMEEMGKMAFPSPYFSTVVQCGTLIAEAGNKNQKKDLLTNIAKGKLVMAFAQYEEDASLDPEFIQMPATASGDDYVLNGTKMFVGDANIADKMIVAARTDEGVTLFIVDAKADGITITKRKSIAKDNTCDVVFKDVQVSKDAILGNPGQGEELINTMALKATVAKCAEMLGGCESAILMTAEYAKGRVQYKTPIAAFQSIQHFLADMKLGYDSCVNYFYKVAWMIDEGIECSTDVSALKSRVNEVYNFIGDRGVQIHGGIGTTREFNIGLFFRRAKAFEFMMGDSEYHNEKIAQALGL
jgi:alkylation response protein AidB-like acyl-CoA dehydrogenase